MKEEREMSPLTEMREEIRVNRGRGVALSENKREKRRDTLKNVTPRPKEERGHSYKVIECHGKTKAIHTAGGASFKKPAEGQSDFINQSRQLSERQDGRCSLRT